LLREAEEWIERERFEPDSKQPYQHFFHICSRIAHNRSTLTIADAPTMLNMAPFE
jgi:hypothetical protein